jgi:hypothetical protein
MPNQWMRNEVLLKVTADWRETERAKSARDERGRGIIAWRTGATARESITREEDDIGADGVRFGAAGRRRAGNGSGRSVACAGIQNNGQRDEGRAESKMSR